MGGQPHWLEMVMKRMKWSHQEFLDAAPLPKLRIGKHSVSLELVTADRKNLNRRQRPIRHHNILVRQQPTRREWQDLLKIPVYIYQSSPNLSSESHESANYSLNASDPRCFFYHFQPTYWNFSGILVSKIRDWKTIKNTRYIYTDIYSRMPVEKESSSFLN